MKCDMHKDCSNPVTHIGDKGFVYCATCAPRRQGYERCRKLRTWEMGVLRSGQPLWYQYRTREKFLQDRAYQGLDPKFNAALADITKRGI